MRRRSNLPARKGYRLRPCDRPIFGESIGRPMTLPSSTDQPARPPATADVPGFEHDIFISYAHVDNLPRGKGWVDAFHEALEWRVARKIGRLGRIWRDKKLDGSQVFNEVIERRIAGSAVFLALNSEGYIGSTYCRQELESFCRQAGRSPYGLQVGERRRVFNVLLTNLHHPDWLADLAGTSGFPFHDGGPEPPSDDEGTIGEPLKLKTGPFDSQIRALADAIFRVLKGIKQTREPEASEPRDEGQSSIYLADTADSLQETRERLAADLRQKGRVVVTGLPPPYDAATHASTVQDATRKAGLSVHLLDGLPGRKIDDDPSMTYPSKQVDIAIETATPQTLWIPQSLELGAVSSESQRTFLDSLEQHTRSTKEYDFVRSTREGLVADILGKLERLETRSLAAPHGDSSSVLLDTQYKDQRIALTLALYLAGRGLQPLILQEADTDERWDEIEAFEKKLTQVRTLVVFFGGVTPKWVLQRVIHARKFVKGSRDVASALEACYVYLLPPAKEMPVVDSSDFKIHVIDNSRSDRFDPDAAAPLLAALGPGTVR